MLENPSVKSYYSHHRASRERQDKRVKGNITNTERTPRNRLTEA